MEQNIAHNLEEKPRTKDILIKENFDFNSLLLSNTTLQGLKDAGFYKPSPIQLKAIPLGRCGLDLIVQAKSGTGKTAVFTIIALEMVKTTRNALQVLVFAPTREIAMQIEDVIKTIGKLVPGLQVGSFIGGLPLVDDIKRLKQCHIAVGAPGRLKHLVEKSHLKTDMVRLLVLDEADKLMEQSFQSDINFVYRNLPERKQVIALSATYPDKLDKFLANYMQSPTFVTPEVENPILLGLRQFVTVVKSHINVIRQLTIKTEELIHLLSKISFTQCLVFFNSQSRAEGISNTLNKEGWNTSYISGAQSQAKRIKAINSLKNFKCKILLTTDLTARGIDAANVDLIINYDVPFEAATYLHRMGRAGRYGSPGLCVTIAAEGNELSNFRNILGEIGGTELSIAKLHEREESLTDIWKRDLNLFEKLSGTVSDNIENRNFNLKESVFDMKKNRIKVKSDTDVMSSDLEQLSVEEKINQKGCENDIGIEVQNVKNILNHNQKVMKEVSQKFSEMDAESLLISLASAKNVLLESTDSSEETVGSNHTVINLKPELHDSAVVQTDEKQEGENNAEELISPASLYPWIPVEENSVLTDFCVSENLLEISSSEDSGSDNILKSEKNHKKRKRKQYKHLNENKVQDSLNNSILLRNIALFKITKMLTSKNYSLFNCKDFDSTVKSIGNFLGDIEKNRQDLISDALKVFETHSCNELLRNLSQYSQQWSQHVQSVETEDPVENLFKSSYLYMIENANHWIDVLGDKYEPEEVEQDVELETEEKADEEDEDSFDSAAEVQANKRRWHYDNKHTKQASSVNAENSYHDYNNQQWIPVSSAQSNFVEGSENLEHSYNPTYASYFDYYRQTFENDAPTFEDVASFNNYFSQWQSQVQSVRDYVQQNIYLQEMNNYHYYSGQYYGYYRTNNSYNN